MWLHYYIENKLEYLSPIVFKTVVLKMLWKDKNQEMWLRFYIEDKTGVCIINGIPHCLTENALKRGKNQEMWLRYYIEDKVVVCIIDSILHCPIDIVLSHSDSVEYYR